MKNALISAIVAAIVAWAVFLFLEKHSAQNQVQAGGDIVMDRVESTGTVRCGYVNNPPFVSLDPNTHEVSGVMVDVSAKIAALTGWKIQWSSETSYSTMAQDMAQGKFDVFCGGGWPIALSEKQQWWAGPLFYSGVEAFARIDDERFGTNFDLKDLDNPAYSISVIDGVAVDRVRAMDFPHATVVALPNISNYGDMILQVVGHKADVVLIEQETAYRYMAKNPGKIKRIGGDRPIRLYAIGYEFPYNAPRLRNVFETAARELVDGGVVDRILTNHEDVPGMFYRVKPPAGNGS
jgi:ABC-type amino acid transport substrate-binding protein